MGLLLLLLVENVNIDFLVVLPETLSTAHDATPYYKYCKQKSITPFIVLNWNRDVALIYKDDFSIGKKGAVCKARLKMSHTLIIKNYFLYNLLFFM